jgi:membrane-associated phospholipid phosphatase
MLGVFGLYIVGLVVLFGTGRFGFVPKEVLLPALFIPPAIMGRFRQFIHDWAIFLALVVLFDALRGFGFSLISSLDLPVYMAYAIDWEGAMLGGSTLPHIMQEAWLGPDGDIGLFEQILIVVHASHFVVFLFFGLVVWYWRPAEFRSFALAFLILLYAGLLIYLLVPTVPPWMASESFEVIPPLRHVTAEVYNTTMPMLARGFDTNPIAAMPSLHTAIPVLMSLVAVRHFRWKSAPIVIYTVLVLLSITYFGEHYLVDVLAGAALAAAAFCAVIYVVEPRWERRHRPRWDFRQTLLVAGLFAAMTVAVGYSSKQLGSGWIPSRDFVAAELDGKSPQGPYYRGFYHHEDEDYAGSVAAFESMEPRLVDRHTVRMQALGYAQLDRVSDALALLADYGRAHPAEPEPLFLATKIAYEAGHVKLPYVAQVIGSLETAYEDPAALRYAAELRAIVEGR